MREYVHHASQVLGKVTLCRGGETFLGTRGVDEKVVARTDVTKK